jgi:hypothetical protein
MSDEPTHIQSRQAEKSVAVAEISLALDQLAEQRRNPDQWERVCLVHAFAAVFSGCYRLAAVEARLAMTPPSERSPYANLPADPFFDRCDLPLLKQVLREAAAEPVCEFPHLGPVQIR